MFADIKHVKVEIFRFHIHILSFCVQLHKWKQTKILVASITGVHYLTVEDLVYTAVCCIQYILLLFLACLIICHPLFISDCRLQPCHALQEGKGCHQDGLHTGGDCTQYQNSGSCTENTIPHRWIEDIIKTSKF